MDKVDFWLTSGWHLLEKDSNNKLLPTEDFMKAYFSRPEVEIVEESCEAEKKDTSNAKKAVNSMF